MKIALLLIFISSVSFSGTINFGKNTYPDEIILDHQFRTKTQCQIGGTCHIFSAVALLEAACYRVLKKHIDISEAYLINRHLNEQFALLAKYPLQKLENSGRISHFDSGHPERTVSRVFQGDVCTENELPLDPSFLDSLGKIISDERVKCNTNKSTKDISEKKIPRVFCQKLNEQIECKLPEAKKDQASPAYKFKTKDPDLQKCLGTRLVLEQIKFTPEIAVKLLSARLPFICEGEFLFPDGTRGSHASTVIGYRFNSNMKNKLEYRLRDSNYSEPRWGWDVNCRKIHYIHF